MIKTSLIAVFKSLIVVNTAEGTDLNWVLSVYRAIYNKAAVRLFTKGFEIRRFQ